MGLLDDLRAEYENEQPPQQAAVQGTEDAPGAWSQGVYNVTSGGRFLGNLLADDPAGAAEVARERSEYRSKIPKTQGEKEIDWAWDRDDGVFESIANVIAAVGDSFDKGGVGAAYDDVAYMFKGIVKQTPNMIPGMIGYGAGAVAGAVGGPVAGIPTALAGGTAGNAVVETAGIAEEMMHEAGVDPTDPIASTKFIEDNKWKILKASGVKSGVISSFDLISMGASRAIMKGATNKAAREVLNHMGVDIADKAAVEAAQASAKYAEMIARHPLVKEAATKSSQFIKQMGVQALEAGGEFGGEFVGSGVALGQWDAKEATLEALSSVGQSVITGAGQAAYQGIKGPVVSLTPAERAKRARMKAEAETVLTGDRIVDEANIAEAERQNLEQEIVEAAEEELKSHDQATAESIMGGGSRTQATPEQAAETVKEEKTVTTEEEMEAGLEKGEADLEKELNNLRGIYRQVQNRIQKEIDKAIEEGREPDTVQMEKTLKNIEKDAEDINTYLAERRQEKKDSGSETAETETQEDLSTPDETQTVDLEEFKSRAKEMLKKTGNVVSKEVEEVEQNIRENVGDEAADAFINTAKDIQDAAIKDRQDKTQYSEPTNNASGESAASVEAMNVEKERKKKGIRHFIVDTRKPGAQPRPAVGVRPEDNTLNPHEALIEVDGDKRTVLNKGPKAISFDTGKVPIEKQQTRKPTGTNRKENKPSEASPTPPVEETPVPAAPVETPLTALEQELADLGERPEGPDGVLYDIKKKSLEGQIADAQRETTVQEAQPAEQEGDAVALEEKYVDRKKLKQGKYTIAGNGRGKLKPRQIQAGDVQGRDASIEGYDREIFLAKYKNNWIVVDKKSGATMGRGETQAEAMENTIRTLNNTQPGKIQAGVNKAETYTRKEKGKLFAKAKTDSSSIEQIPEGAKVELDAVTDDGETTKVTMDARKAYQRLYSQREVLAKVLDCVKS